MKVYPQNFIINVQNNFYIDHDEEKICRICYEEDENISKLLYPCACSGSIKYIHDHCLREWIKTKNILMKNYKCELCHKKLFLKRLYIEEKFILFGIYNTYYKYCIDIFLYIFLTNIWAYIIYLIDISNDYLLVNSFDNHKDKFLLKIIKNEIKIGGGMYIYFDLSFTIFIVSMFYYTVSTLLAIYYLKRKLLFLKLIWKTLLCCLFSSSVFIYFFMLYNSVGDFQTASVFIFCSCILSLVNWPLMKMYCYYLNQDILIINDKYNKTEILNATINPLLNLR